MEAIRGPCRVMPPRDGPGEGVLQSEVVGCLFATDETVEDTCSIHLERKKWIL